jgi:hypothetical protein
MIKHYYIKSKTDFPSIRAEGVVFSDETCVTRLRFCKNPFLIQEKFNEKELLDYIKNNDNDTELFIYNILQY